MGAVMHVPELSRLWAAADVLASFRSFSSVWTTYGSASRKGEEYSSWKSSVSFTDNATDIGVSLVSVYVSNTAGI